MNNLTRSLFSVGIATAVFVTADAAILTGGTGASAGKALNAQSMRVLEEQAFLEARRAINREEFELAAELFAAFRDPASEYTGRYKADSYYWEAFARYRLGDLPEALVLLELLEGGYDEYTDYRGNEGRLHDEVVDLRLRIRRQQAEQGDPQAAEEVLRWSEALLHPELLRAYSDSARQEYAAALAAQQERSDSARREYATALQAQQARSDSARQEYAVALEAQRARADSARREYAAALQAQQARSDSARQEYAAALEVQRARADSARREYSAALQAYRAGSLPAVLTVADTMAEQLTESVSALQADLVATRATADQVTDVVTAMATDVMTAQATDVATAQATDVIAAIARAGLVSQVREGCENMSVQQAALTALLRLETERMPSVRSVLESQDECSMNLRRQAITWLSRQETDEAQRELIALAESHPDLETRESATRGLWRFPNLTAVHALSRILATTEDADLRSAAIESLRRSEPREARQTLITFARDLTQPMELRQAALTAYGRRSDVTTEELMRLHDQPVLRGLETSILQNLGRRVQAEEEQGVATWLFDRAMDKQRTVEIRRAALEAWSRSPSADLVHLARSYEELEEPDLKERIFYALYRKTLSDEAAAPAVVDKMIELARGEEDREIRETAIHWIGRTGSERAVEFLLELLRQRPGDSSGAEGSVVRTARSDRG